MSRPIESELVCTTLEQLLKVDQPTRELETETLYSRQSTIIQSSLLKGNRRCRWSTATYTHSTWGL